MKRENPDAASAGECSASPDMGKGKMMMMGMEDDNDELLAALGYKVRASDMADVAQKLEQLEMAMGTGVAAANDDPSFLPNLAADTVHYNPSDLSTWLDSMLSELNAPLPPPPPPPPPQQQQCRFDLPPTPMAGDAGGIDAVVDFPGACHRAAAVSSPLSSTGGRLLYGSRDSQTEITSPRDRKRMRTATCSSSSSSRSRAIGEGMAGGGSTTEVASSLKAATGPSPAPLSVVVVDTQEAGIRLVHALMACAEAVQQENLKAADALVKQISSLAATQSGPMRKVAGFFADGLAGRIYRLRPQPGCALDSAFDDLLHMHFYESCPYLKFAHFTANQAILEAFAGCQRVHVIDFGMKQGMQWPALLQALALREGGPPSFRLTGIGPPQLDNSDALQQVGWKLAQLAKTIHVDFQYRGLAANSLADLEPHMLLESPSGSGHGSDDGDSEPEAVALNSVGELHRLLARQGAVEKVLGTVRAVRPRIVTVVEQEANHNTSSFLERFTEALHYYSTMFDSLEGGTGCSASIPGETGATSVGVQHRQDRVLAEVYLGRQICNIVACEGAERTERHETLAHWRRRMGRAGFEPAPLGSNAFKQASMLLALYAGGHGYRVEENDGCLTLGWHTRPLIATSAWRLAGVGGANPVAPAVVAR